MLCWEGYDAPAIVDPWLARSSAGFEAQTLLADVDTAHRLLSGEAANWDILNINNAYIRDFLYPRGLIDKLDAERFAYYRQSIHPVYESLLPWSYAEDGSLIGIGQRFGPFNLVVNTSAISQASAEDQGFGLADDSSLQRRFAILDYPDFNVFHCCIAAGLNPFDELGDADLERFATSARNWYRAAAMVTSDHHNLNRALLEREIDFYISGGIYTASPARLEGHHNIVAITPRHGPIDGKGGIVFSEITSLLKHAVNHPQAESYLRYMLEPATSVAIAFVGGTCNPVAQMGDPEVFSAFSRRQLEAIQWDSLAADLSRCAHYRIPPQNDSLLKILTTEKTTAGWL